MTKRNEKVSIMFQTFAGEYVTMITRMSMERSITSEDMTETLKTPMAVQGFLIEADDDYYYLGVSPALINQSVKIDEVVHVEVTKEEKGLMEELFQNGEIPPEEDFN